MVTCEVCAEHGMHRPAKYYRELKTKAVGLLTFQLCLTHSLALTLLPIYQRSEQKAAEHQVQQ